MRQLNTSSNTWLIYALGGGWGHLNRAIALGRIASRNRPVKILTNTPYDAISKSFYLKLTVKFPPFRQRQILKLLVLKFSKYCEKLTINV